MTRIDYYLTPLSPFVYLAGDRPARIAAAAGAEIRYLPVDPASLFARTGGQPLAQRHESRRSYRMQELRRWAQRLGLPMVLEPAHFPTNPAPASYALIAAQDAGGGDMAALLAALGRACWEDERDIASDTVIAECLSHAGFDPALVNSGMLVGAETYTRNLDAAVAAGVFGMPFFVVGSERFWGQDRMDFLAEHLGVAA